MISQITAAGSSPAMRHRSTDPSVWPALASTPPSRARSGKTWPGVHSSEGWQPVRAAVRIVWARSWAEMPVEMPSRASTLTVKAVPYRDGPRWGWRGSWSPSIFSGAMARQISPLPALAMNAIASGVTFSAARTRSPSFSRFSSSTRMTIFPAFRSATASAIRHVCVIDTTSSYEPEPIVPQPPAAFNQAADPERTRTGGSHAEEAEAAEEEGTLKRKPGNHR